MLLAPLLSLLRLSVTVSATLVARSRLGQIWTERVRVADIGPPFRAVALLMRVRLLILAPSLLAALVSPVLGVSSALM